MEEAKMCKNCKASFTIDASDFNFYEKIRVPPPTFCPECRLVRRLCFRNERSLYKRACDRCQKRIISIYDTAVPFPVYCPECWRSDKWEGLEYGQNYDFSQPFFAQWRELFLKVPRPSVFQIGNCVNVEYTNLVKDAKNVYLAYSVVGSEDVYYSGIADNSKAVIDSYNVMESELVYENIGGVKNYNCQYAYWSSSCLDCSFVLDCVNCSYCYGCVNLRNKQYCIWNEQYSKEKYFEKIKDFNTGSYKLIGESFKKFWDFSLKFPRRYARMTNCVDSIGDELRNCKKSTYTFNTYDTEDTKFGYRCLRAKNAMDVCFMEAELAYEHASGGSFSSFNIKFVMDGYHAVNEGEYLDFCQSSSNLFGCIGLKSKKYCILNKQYEKEEYAKLVEKIKQHMAVAPHVDKKGRVYKYGEFFPFELSPFGYNEALVNDLFPLSEKEATKRGYNWKEKTENKYTITKKASELPNDIKNTDDSILGETIECAVTKKPFKIVPYELEFYRRMNIPIPRIHPDERYKRRLALRNPLKLWHRKCMKGGCKNEFETSYAPNQPEIVCCEKCYQSEVY